MTSGCATASKYIIKMQHLQKDFILAWCIWGCLLLCFMIGNQESDFYMAPGCKAFRFYDC